MSGIIMADNGNHVFARHSLHILLIISLAFVLYANTLGGKFICDDLGFVQLNDHIKNYAFIWKVLVGDVGEGTGNLSQYNRPIVMFTYMVDYSLWRLNVLGYHISNIVSNILLVLCIYWFMNIICGNTGAAFLTSILFLAHPINTEAAAYISGRADSLALLLILLCLVFYIKYLRENKSIFFYLAALSSILAVLTKENSIIIPFLLLLCNYLLGQKLKSRYFLLSLSAIAVFFLLKFTFMYSLISLDAASPVIIQRIPGLFAAITEYFSVIFFPVRLQFEYGNKVFSFLDLKVIIGMSITACLLASTAINALRKNKLLTFCFAWFVVGLMPVNNIFPVFNHFTFMMWHWVYVSSLGVYIALSALFFAKFKQKFFSYLVKAAVIIMLVRSAGITLKENVYWGEPILFYERNLEYNPGNWRFIHNLALNYGYKKDIPRAIELYKRAIKINPRSVITYYNLAEIYHDSGRDQEAIRLYLEAAQFDGGSGETYYRLGNLFKKMGKEDEALFYFKEAVKLNPGHLLVHRSLYELYKNNGEEEKAGEISKKAISLIEEALSLEPSYAILYRESAYYYKETNSADALAFLYQRAIKNNADYFDAYLNTGKLYAENGEYKEAIKLLRRASRINPDSAETYLYLVRSYRAIGDMKKAAVYSQKAEGLAAVLVNP